MSYLKRNDGTFTSDGTGSDNDIATWNGKEVWHHYAGALDLLNPVGAGVIVLPDEAHAHPLPAGWNCILHVGSPLNAFSGSGCTQIRTLGDAWIADFWSSSHKYGRFMNLTGDTARLSYNGDNEYCLTSLNMHQNEERSQRSLTTLAYKNMPVGPVHENKTIVVDVAGCGGNVMLEIEPLAVWCPPSRVTSGHYPQYKFSLLRQGLAAAGTLGIRCVQSIGGPDGPHIIGSNDQTVTGNNRGYLYLKDDKDHVQIIVSPNGARANWNNRLTFATS